MLSSRVNLDILALPYLMDIKNRLKIEELHAGKLGNDRLVSIVPDILLIYKKFHFSVDFYKVVKKDHALICFFESIFDSNINPAVSSQIYWTPVRYFLFLQLNSLFDIELIKKVWIALIEENSDIAATELKNVCMVIKERLNLLSDKSSQKTIGEAIQWVLDNPSKIAYNINSGDGISHATPNLVGFQMVLEGIAKRLRRNHLKASKIIIDEQREFNDPQQNLTEVFLKISKYKLEKYGYGFPDFNLKGMPAIPLTFISSDESSGLQLVDLFAWLYMRLSEGRNLPQETRSLLMVRGNRIELSLDSISRNLEKCLYNKQNLTVEEENRIKQMIEIQSKLKSEGL